LSQSEDGKHWHVTVAGSEEISADAVILATPAFQTGILLSSVAPIAADELGQIAYASTATVSRAYRRADFPRPPDSFGFVVPAVEQRKLMACTFSSLKYPGRAPADDILLRAFVGGALQPELFDTDDATMEKNVRGELASLLGVTAEPRFSRIRRHPNSMPQYHVGHQARIQRIENALSKLPALALAGSAYHGVGISDCVRSGEEAAEKIVAHLEANP
jgi:oxygen-dependent protoporphyrinogen oxidase